MKIVVTGATGFIGRALCNSLAKENSITALTQNPEKAAALLDKTIKIIKWNTNLLDGWEKSIDGSDAIVNLAGANVALKRWNKEVKAEILNSRMNSSRILVKAIKNSKVKPKTIITASAIGFYGSRDDEILDEESKAGDGFLAGVCKDTEGYSREFETLGLRTVVIRTGIVLDTSGGALPKMITPFKFYLGGPLASGNQWMSWISLADEIGAIKFLVQNNAFKGAFNLTSPEPLRNRKFMQILGCVLKKPSWLPVPAFALKIIFGEMAKECFLTSQRVLPKKLIDAGFKFRYADLESALYK